MNIYMFDDEAFVGSSLYNSFIKENPSFAYLNIRTSAAFEAVPISGVRIIVSKMFDNNKIIFFDGITDMSGMINDIKLPTPSLVSDDLDLPKGIVYDIEAIYESDNIDRNYKVLMYPGIHVVQNINLIPTVTVASWEVDYGS